MGKVNLTPQQSMDPVAIDGEILAKQTCVAVGVASAQEDHRATERGGEVQGEALGKDKAVRSSISSEGGFASICGDVALGGGGQVRHTA